MFKSMISDLIVNIYYHIAFFDQIIYAFFVAVK
jgi:hypothetical protein